MISFAATVQPLFQSGCDIGGSTCHGGKDVVSQGRPFLGLPGSGGDAVQILAGVVDQPSVEDPEMSLVKPGNPDDSYLLHKLVGDQGKFADQCSKGQSMYPTCGSYMPYRSPCFQADQIDSIRKWIAQGAKNN